MLQQFIPSPNEESEPTDKSPARKHVDRPPFSVGAMSTNFRRFNARIGVAFVFQNQLIHLFSWTHPSQTLSFLAIYTFICLESYALAIIPLAVILYFIMLPSFLTRHPPPPSVPLKDLYPLTGPPLAPPTTIRPAPELSKDFFHNMRDLQNSMEDFSRLHDWIIANVAPVVNFSDERFSSALFIGLFAACIALFLVAHLLPWRLLALLGGWVATVSGHPTIAAYLEEQNPSPGEADPTTALRTFAASDISLSPDRETREVEIFELQYRPLYSAHSEWATTLFTPAAYTPLSPARIAGLAPRGARHFEDVQPPAGWRWADKKWQLDLLAREWVEERLIAGVEVEVEGERWVMDLREDVRNESGSEDDGKKEMKVGEWRRRRWVRAVERIAVEGDGG
jgi:Integral peroxisomal membrane peroxin